MRPTKSNKCWWAVKWSCAWLDCGYAIRRKSMPDDLNTHIINWIIQFVKIHFYRLHRGSGACVAANTDASDDGANAINSLLNSLCHSRRRNRGRNPSHSTCRTLCFRQFKKVLNAVTEEHVVEQQHSPNSLRKGDAQRSPATHIGMARSSHLKCERDCFNYDSLYFFFKWFQSPYNSLGLENRKSSLMLILIRIELLYISLFQLS